MKSISQFALAAGIVLAMVFTLSCSSGDDDEGGGGGISGTSWEQRVTVGNTSDFTHTISFNSATGMSYNRKGWGMVGKEK